MNPPIVYPLTNPRSHIIIRITKIVHSMLFPLSERSSLSISKTDHL
jgi:hypothetical protein